MAKALFIVALFLCFAACVAHAFVLRPTTIAAIGTAKKGQFLWKPQRAISLSETIAAVRISLSGDTCDDRKGECKYAVAFTTDGGDTFHLDERPEVVDFCGSSGMKVVNAEEGVATLTCVSTSTPAGEGADGALAYKTKTFTFANGSDSITVAEGSETVSFLQPAASFDLPAATALYLGDTIATFDGPTSKGIHGRNVDLLLTNGTTIHAFYKSTDAGSTWEYTSALPFPMGSESALHVTGATKVMIIAGESNEYKQAVSVFLGSRWEKVEKVDYSSPLSTYSSTLGTTIYGGLRGKPGLIGMAAGRKRGTEKLVDFANLHNKVVTRLVNEDAIESFKGLPVGNFSADFLNATEFNCVAGGSIADTDGCATSSYTAILPVGNGSTVLAFYDKLTNGYNPSTGLAGEQTLLVMKLALNETKEQKEIDDKAKEEREAEEKRKAAEERRKQAQRDAEKREREKKRAKNRADKAKKKAFAKLDKPNILAAKEALQKVNGDADDLVIIRDVLVEYAEQEKDTFFDAFAPDADIIAAREEQEEEEKEAAKKAKKSKKSEAPTETKEEDKDAGASTEDGAEGSKDGGEEVEEEKKE